MASDTFATKRVSKVYVSGDKRTESVVAGEAGIYPGYIIRIASDEKAYLCNNSDGQPSGIVEVPIGADLDTVIASGDMLEFYRIGQDTEVWMFLLYASPLAAIRDGELITTSATDGKGMKWAYTDTAEATDSNAFNVGRASIVDTGHLTEDHLIKVNLAGG